MSNQVVKESVKCETAEEFLNALSPIGTNFMGKALDSNWLFRGQGQDFPLIPSLFRKDDFSKDKLKSLTKHNIDDYSRLIRAELDFIFQFFEISDKRGLVLPDDSQNFRFVLEKLKKYSESDKYGFSYQDDTWTTLIDTLSVIALAQHYGIPTRLLDWTRQAYIAAFFAAEDAYKHKYNPSSLLVVWAFSFPNFDKKRRSKDALFDIRVVTAPSATNINLKAQQGIFTLMSFDITKESEGTCLPFDKVIEELATKAKARPQDLDRGLFNFELRKFTLPVSENEKLLFLLAKMDITSSTVYPGYHSIISDLQMRRSFEDL